LRPQVCGLAEKIYELIATATLEPVGSV
jgi:hypothetical protein